MARRRAGRESGWTGTVQGVGFRPFAFRLAEELGLRAGCCNDERGVLPRSRAEPERVERFLAPPRGRRAARSRAWSRVEATDADPAGDDGLPDRRLATSGGRAGRARLRRHRRPARECLAELLDPADRRHRYPFTNCTNCGPRFTIVRGVPYDRPADDDGGLRDVPARAAPSTRIPRDRRFHAQPNACPVCGPRAWLADADGRELDRRRSADAIARPPRLLAAAADPRRQGRRRLPSRLPRRATRGGRRAPLAQASRGQAVRAAGAATSRPRADARRADARPRRGCCAAASARSSSPAGARARRGVGGRPARADLGVMLPYSPLHHLLAADAGEPLVMTSGNVSDEPIAYGDADALARLARDRRPVPPPRPPDPHPHRRLGRRARSIPALRDDAAADPPLARLRPAERSRCRPPLTRPILACGAELKSTFCLAKGGARLGRPPHRRPQELRDAALVPRRDRPFRAALRGRAGARRPRPAPRLPLDALRARARGRASTSPSSTTTPTSPPACRARHRRPGGRRDLRRHRARRRRHGVGRRDPRRRCARLRARRPALPRPACRVATPRPASPGGWRARGWRPRSASECAGDSPHGRVPRSSRALGGGLRPRRERDRLAADDERRAALRRCRGPLRVARGGQLRGPGGGGAGGDRRPTAGSRLPDGVDRRPRGAGPDRSARDDPGDRLGPCGRRGVAGRLRPLPRGGCDGDGRCLCSACRGARARRRGPLGRRLSEPAAAGAHRAAGCRCRPAPLVPRLLPPNDGGITYGQVAIAAARAGA